MSTFKKLITPGLAAKLGKQIYHHKSAQRGFHEDILCSIETGYPEVLITACLKSFIPNYGFHTGGIITFYKSKHQNVDEALNTLTAEVSEAKIKYPQYNYFRGFRFLKADAQNYIKNRNAISPVELEEMISKGNGKRSEIVAIYEMFKSGAWSIADYPPWNYGMSDDDDGLFDQYGEPRV
jgi:hypothetical protein